MTIFLFIFLLFNIRVVAQNVPVIITGKDITLEKALKQIEEQTSYTVAYNHSEINITKKVSLPKGYLGLEQTLTLILRNTGCRYIINEKHILIVRDMQKNEHIKSNEIFKSKLSGRVLDKGNNIPLAYATVTLLDGNDKAVLSGITNDEGDFRLMLSEPPNKLRISFVGYKTFYKDLLSENEDMGSFYLEEEENMLKEVIITGETIKYNIDRNTYIITSKMKEGVSNASELLDKIPGVSFDRISNTIKVGNESSVLLLVDGMQQPQEYIKTIHPDRISTIEIVNQPSGRYMTEGYNAIINFILKKNYAGYDVYINNLAIINPNGTNGNDWLANEEPTVSFSYTKNKINIYGMASYLRNRWNTEITKEQIYKEMMILKSKETFLDEPNDIYKHNGNKSSLGINYQITPQHILSIQGDYSYRDITTENKFLMDIYSINENYEYNLATVNYSKTKENDIIGSLFYKGHINEKIHLYSDFYYNYYFNDVDNNYEQKSIDMQSHMYYKRSTINKEHKNQTVFNLEGSYILSPRISFNIGYSNLWRKYDAVSSVGVDPLHYNELRNKAFVYIALNPFGNFHIKTGVATENIHTESGSLKSDSLNVMPYIQLNYSIGKHFNINATYVTSNVYPSLYELSPMLMAYDSIISRFGNQYLRSSMVHTASVRFTLWNKLSIIPSYIYIPENVSEIYLQEGFNHYRTYANMEEKHYKIQLIYDQPIGDYFNWKNTITLKRNEIKKDGLSNSLNDWLMDSEINYYNRRHELGLSLGYHRGMEKTLLLQGQQMINLDSWVFKVNKLFLDKRLSMELSYIPPVNWGIRREQLRDINTLGYNETTSLNLKTYNNMLFFRVGFRINSGRVKRSGRETSIEREEREQRTIQF